MMPMGVSHVKSELRPERSRYTRNMTLTSQLRAATRRALDRLFPRRTTVLYVTIDDVPEQPGHEPNIERLREIAARRGLTVERRHMSEVDDRDPSLFMLFLAGSFPEWIRTRTDAVWEAQLARFAELVRATRVPILAVCGSHQLIAQAYGGWEAIGHVRANGDATPRSIARERETGESLVPTPRLGEVGAFPMTIRVDDPLFAGMGPRLYFMAHHHDEVVEEALPRELLPLLDPDEDAPSVDDGKVARSRVQALRLEDPTRILYSLQFHPELPSAVVRGELIAPDDALLARADADGERLLERFFDVAAAHWSASAGPDVA